MGSGPSQTTNQSQVQNQTQNQAGTTTQQTNPWAPTAGALTDLINQISGTSTAVTPEQSAAISQLGGSLAGLPNYAAPSEQAIGNIFGTSTQPQQGMLGSAYGTYTAGLSPFTNPANLDPTKTPGFSSALGATEQDITNQVNQSAAASGITPSSPAYAAALSRGLAAGVAPTIAQQYNTNVGTDLAAQGAGFGAAGTTAGGQAQLMGQDVQTQLAAMQAAGQLPSVVGAAPSAYLNAANQAYNLPYSNINTSLGMLSPLAQAFGQTAGGYSGTGTTYGTTQGTSTTQTSQPWYNTAIGAGMLGLGLLGKSDVRAKENLVPVGMLFNDLPIYKFNYRQDPTKTLHLGLIAQEVEQIMPEAVATIGGEKWVNYDLATREAA
jgi:hypothetical protein